MPDLQDHEVRIREVELTQRDMHGDIKSIKENTNKMSNKQDDNSKVLSTILTAVQVMKPEVEDNSSWIKRFNFLFVGGVILGLIGIIIKG